MPSYYALLTPLINAFDAYVAGTGISKVYITGHSMGGAMALEYMSRHAGSQYQAVTFAASPFGDTFLGVPFRKSYSADSRITQIEIEKDTVPFFDERVGLSSSNPRPGQLINFAGNQTLDTPDHISKFGGFGLDYYGRTANHSMDYYRQITDSVDADSWTRILVGTGTQTVLLGGQQVYTTDWLYGRPTTTASFIVDGQLSGTNTSVGYGNDGLSSLDFKIVYGGKGSDWLIAGTNDTQLLGGVGNDRLQGNAGNDKLVGGTGADTMAGGTGNDTYYVDNAGDTITENFGSGVDVVYTSVSYSLNANVDSLFLTGAAAIGGYGNADANDLTGNSADNILNGLGGIDNMAGGLGNDSYYVDNTGDYITEKLNEGTDIVYSTVTYILKDNIENLTLTGTAVIDATGNADNNILTGNAGNNVLDGKAGADTMRGGAGNDSYYVDNVGDVVIETGASAWDTIYSTVSYSLSAYVRTMSLIGIADIDATGNTSNNILVGNTGNNSLDGKAGADNMAGDAGNDSYYVDNIGDVVTENVNAGFDKVYTSINLYTALKPLTANVEALELRGVATIGYGNDLNNQLIGNALNNTLNGGAGVDTMAGGAGNDSYTVDNTADVITENTGAGTDIVYASATYRLSDNIEKLTLTGTAAIDATGNADNNVLTGNIGNNVLTGGEGADTLIGGRGQDSYNLTETIAATDIVRIAKGDSLVDSYDTANNFSLGTGGSTTGVDKLDLASTVIAANTIAKNGIDSGIIHSHHISLGIISFDVADAYTTPLTVTATELPDVFSYLQANIINNNTVAFVSEGNTYVFQDGGVNDTLVELVGASASSMSTSGLATNSVWIV